MDLDTLVELNRSQRCSERDDFTDRRYLSFLQHLGPDVRDVLDIGCNTGRGGAAIKALRPELRITGLDCVQERVEALNRSVYQGALCGFMQDVPLRSGSFDAIVAAEIIEHVPPSEVPRSLCECWRLLRLRGRVLLTTPNPFYLRNRLQGLSVLMDPSHLSQHTIASLRRRLEDVGFTRVKVYGNGRVSKIIGSRWPLRLLYGSYLVVAQKW